MARRLTGKASSPRCGCRSGRKGPAADWEHPDFGQGANPPAAAGSRGCRRSRVNFPTSPDCGLAGTRRFVELHRRLVGLVDIELDRSQPGTWPARPPPRPGCARNPPASRLVRGLPARRPRCRSRPKAGNGSALNPASGSPTSKNSVERSPKDPTVASISALVGESSARNPETGDQAGDRSDISRPGDSERVSGPITVLASGRKRVRQGGSPISCGTRPEPRSALQPARVPAAWNRHGPGGLFPLSRSR